MTITATKPVLEKDKSYVRVINACRENRFIIFVIFGVLFGVASGLFLRQYNLDNETLQLIEYPGELFLRSLELLILPFIITCIITGTANLNIKENKQIAVYTIVIFFILSLVNVALGMSMAMLIPASGSPEDGSQPIPVKAEDGADMIDGFLDIGRNMVPTNLFQATFAHSYTVVRKGVDETTGETNVEKKLDVRRGTNMMGLLVFCTAFGFVLGTMDEKKQILLDFFGVLYDVTQKLLVGAIWFTPIGTACIICAKLAAIPELAETLNQLSYFFVLVIAGLMIYAVIILPVALFVITRINPYKYFLALMPAIICTFSTATKSTAVPMTMQLLEDKANANKTVTKFVLPIGIINLNGTAFFLGFSIIFLAHRCGIYFTGSDIISLGLGCTLLSMSGASIPSASLVLLITLCNTVGVPSENVGILIAVDWFLDRVRTINNLLGDCFTVAVVQHMSRKQLAEKVVVEKVCKKIPNNKSGENRVQSDGSQTNKAYKQSPIMNQNHKQSPLMNHANNNNNKQSPILNHTYKQSPVMNHKLSPMITRTEMVC